MLLRCLRLKSWAELGGDVPGQPAPLRETTSRAPGRPVHAHADVTRPHVTQTVEADPGAVKITVKLVHAANAAETLPRSARGAAGSTRVRQTAILADAGCLRPRMCHGPDKESEPGAE
jgi:hypothetical protein